MNETQKLIDLLEDAKRLLRAHSVVGWSDWIARIVSCLQVDRSLGVEELLKSYGGMGSFNDLVVCPENGHNVQKNTVAAVNQHLDKLRADIYVAAMRIKRGG